jgi:hypothetical protein
MIHSAGAGVKTPARLPFAFRADPVALDGLKLTRTARAVFALLLDNARSRGWRSRLGNATMARILDCCPMTVSRALGRLESAGLIRRELIAGGRIRTGIVVTWEGVRREGLTGQPSVRRESPTGSAQESNGVRRERLTDQSSTQSDDQTVGLLPAGKDPGEVPDPATAAAFLRAMIQAGRKAGEGDRATGVAPSRGGSTAPPPAPPSPRTRTEPKAPPVPVAPVPPDSPRQDSPRREVGVMSPEALEQSACGGPTGPPALGSDRGIRSRSVVDEARRMKSPTHEGRRTKDEAARHVRAGRPRDVV